ncbi:MAG: hypothetical protein HYX84_03875 [Chloroflexi bacterium]|nr:hypothetical protein [Chloroflexota bacterium]
MTKRKYPGIFRALLLFSLLALLVSCASSRLTPQVVIDRALVAMGELETYRAELTVSTVSTVEGETNQFTARVEFVAPDRAHVTQSSAHENLESITIGDTLYSRDPSTNEWRESKSPLPPSSLNIAAGLGEAVRFLVGVTQLDDEAIDGADSYHYKGAIDMKARWQDEKAKLDPSQPDYEQRLQGFEQLDLVTFDVEVELWVTKKDSLVRKMVVRQEIVEPGGTGVAGGGEARMSTTAVYRFLDFNQSIQIEPP